MVTEVTVKLIPLPPFRALLVLGFDSMKAAARAIRAIFQRGFLPSALEVADEFTLDAARRRTGSRRLRGARALLMVELDGQEKSVRFEARSLEKLAREHAPFLSSAPSAAPRREALGIAARILLLAARHRLGQIKPGHRRPAEPAGGPLCLHRQLQKKFGLPVACFGHAGDGNIHVNVMYDEAWPGVKGRTSRALDELFRQVLAWDGVITGEHGIGLAKKRWWPLAVSPASAPCIGE